MSTQVKVEINRYFDDKYHGRIATGGSDEWLILSRRNFWSEWIVVSCGRGVCYKEGDSFDWFPVQVEEAYDPYGKFEVTVSRALSEQY
jgi:hypothetical protein